MYKRQGDRGVQFGIGLNGNFIFRKFSYDFRKDLRIQSYDTSVSYTHLAIILGTKGIEEAYRTGRGKIRVRAVTEIESMPNGKSRILVHELPYMVNKARLIEKIAELVRDKKIDGITGITDESSREGMRINIELRRDANANVVLNQLFKHTQLQDTYGVIMLALVGTEPTRMQPKVMNILEILQHYIRHQEDVCLLYTSGGRISGRNVQSSLYLRRRWSGKNPPHAFHRAFYIRKKSGNQGALCDQ